MYESTLSIDINRKSYLDYVYGKLKPHIKLTDAVVAYTKAEDRVYLSIACEDEFAEVMHLEIISQLAEIYAMGFKYDYLKRKLKINRENLLIKTLLNTMTVFDSNNDKKLIRNELYGNKIELFDKRGKKIKLIKPVGESKSSEEMILFNLICLAPKKVLISDEEKYSKEFLNIVRKFF